MWFGMLGPLLVQDGAGAARPVAGARQRALLATLLVRANQMVPAGELAEIMWDGAPPAGAAALRTQVMRLRRSLGDEAATRIVTRGPGYAITLGVGELDATMFEALYRDASAAVRAQRWHQAAAVTGRALGLWRADVLADVDSRVLREECAGRLEQLRVQATEWRVEAAMHLGRHHELVPELRDLAQRYPLREHIHGQLMLALYRCGRQAEALDAYQHARKVLIEEVGVEPGAPLRDLHRQILAADPGLSPEPGHDVEPGLSAPEPGYDDRPGTDAAGRSPAAGPRQLPAPVPHFTGRADALKTLTQLAGQAEGSGGAVVISAIDGMPGVGKTALAVQAGHLVADQFPDGQLFVDLHGHTSGRPPAEPAEVLAALLAADGVDPRYLPADLDGRTAMWRGRLAGQRVLLILDNAASSAQVAPLLPGTAGCLVLVTSRRFLGDLPAAAEVPLDVLPPDEARAMFTAIAPRAAAEPAAVAELVALCGHLALAISLLARLFTRHRSWTTADLIAETRARLLTVSAENRTVAAAFEASYQDLDPGRQRFFRHLGLHPGPDIDLYAAAALAGLPLDETATHLDALHGDRLLAEPVLRRYRMHDLIRQYARVLAAEGDTDDRERAADRLLDHYQHTAEAAAAGRAPVPADGSRPGPDQARAWLTAERANLVACISYAATRHEPARVVGLTAAIAAHLRSDGPWPQASALHAAAAETAQRSGDQPGHAHALLNLGELQCLASNYPGARTTLDQALGIFRAIGDRAGEAKALRTLGAVLRLAGDYPGATGLLADALGMFRGLGDRLGEASALLNLGSVRQTTGDYPGATIVTEQALLISRGISDRIGEAYAQFSLGGVHRLTGDYPAASSALEQAITIFRSIDSRIGEAYALQYLGEVRRLTGDHLGASIALQRSLNICRAVGDQVGEAYALLNLGAVRRVAGDYRGANGLLAEALDIYRSIDHRGGEAEASIETGAVQLALGDTPQARVCYDRALELARSAGTQLEEARALEGIGKCAAQLSDADGAGRALRQALDIYQRLGAADAIRLSAEMQADVTVM